MNEHKSPAITIPGAIIIAGALIAVALMWTKRPVPPQSLVAKADMPAEIQLAPVTAADHILGNPNAPIKLVEYSDPSCPFCKMFHPTMVQFMNTYGPTGKVAWIYRHFPLDKEGTAPDGGILHPNAGHEAEAFECSASLGGNDTFWKFAKAFYETTPSVTQTSPTGLDQKKLPTIAKSVGLDPVAFSDCVASNQFKDKIDKQYVDGLSAGVNGTPETIVITPNGTKIPLYGAQSYATLKTIVDTLIANPSATLSPSQ